MSTSRIAELSAIIASQTEVLDEYLQNQGLPAPSFSVDAPSDAFGQSDAIIAKAKTDVVEASIKLRQLLEGPVKLLLPECNFAPLAAIHRFKIASHVPLSGTTSFADLARKCNLLENDLCRIIRYAAIHHHVFCEPEKGFVAHSAASKMLAESEMVRNLMGLQYGECWPAHARAVDAMSQRSEEPNISGYALANGTSLNTFEFFAQNPERARGFAAAMSGTSPASLDALATYFDWQSLPEGGTVVDVGGANGHVSCHLARAFPHLRFVVQDMPEVAAGAQEKIPEELCGRVSVVGHDMFTEQTVKEADVYLLRYVLHDWPDKYCIKVLKSLVPALKKGARVVIQDHLLPEPGTLPLLQEMQLRSMDAIMLSLFNSRERGADDWKSLFQQANADYGFFSATRIKEGASGIIQVEWAGDEQ
ncbi:putative O-methyltransferase [Lophiostoma macrostomum CBS 122681]|uniref:Putative O-methyltransferase n=1 Tax=Lophiostoma macrostomum CBS 122681 TaxID=1314788 RepID=A0A6A6TKM6_9PLEO|nr:putative O-methyltransferase [Lophiostoma macrostomum CBS 122681]